MAHILNHLVIIIVIIFVDKKSTQNPQKLEIPWKLPIIQ